MHSGMDMLKPRKKWLNTLNRILDFFALEKEATLELLAEKTGKNYSTILRRVNDLEKTGLIQLNRMEQTESKGKEKKIYKITRRGLIYSLMIFRKTPEKIDEIAKSHTDAFLTFEKWNFFEKNGYHDFILNRLMTGVIEDAAAYLRMEIVTPKNWERRPFTETDEIHKKIIDDYVFGVYLLNIPYKNEKIEFEREKMAPFWKTIKTDRRISDWVQLQLEGDKIRVKGELEAIEEGIKIWDSIAK